MARLLSECDICGFMFGSTDCPHTYEEIRAYRENVRLEERIREIVREELYEEARTNAMRCPTCGSHDLETHEARSADGNPVAAMGWFVCNRCKEGL